MTTKNLWIVVTLATLPWLGTAQAGEPPLQLASSVNSIGSRRPPTQTQQGTASPETKKKGAQSGKKLAKGKSKPKKKVNKVDSLSIKQKTAR